MTAITEGKMSKTLKKFLQDNIISKEVQDELAVSEAKVSARELPARNLCWPEAEHED